jgi:MFS superfamily sulfate permease-like transporter
MRSKFDFLGLPYAVPQETEKLFDHIDTAMWILFALGVAALLTYSWKTANDSKGLKKYLILSVPNIVFHVIASIIVFLTLEETGEHIIRYFLTDFDPGQPYHYTLSALSGMFGSMFLALIFELGKIIINKAKSVFS